MWADDGRREGCKEGGSLGWLDRLQLQGDKKMLLLLVLLLPPVYYVCVRLCGVCVVCECGLSSSIDGSCRCLLAMHCIPTPPKASSH